MQNRKKRRAHKLSLYENEIYREGVCLSCKKMPDGPAHIRWGSSEHIYTMSRDKAEWCRGYCERPAAAAEVV